MIDALFVGLDVAVEHRDVGAHAQLVGSTVNGEIAIAAALVVRDLPTHALGKDLGAATRQRVEPCIHQLAQHLLVALAIEIREEGDLDGGETLEMNARLDPFEATKEVGVVVERQIRVQAVDDVDFGERLMGALPQLVPSLLERHGVGAVVSRLQPGEGAEQAACDADVRRFEADVVVVEGARAVTLFALAIGEPADREKIRGLEELDAVAKIKALTLLDLLRDVDETGGGEAGRQHLVIG